jgi:hypothetical protein
MKETFGRSVKPAVFAVAAALALGAAGSARAELGYTLDVTTGYAGSNPFPNQLTGAGYAPSPDTSCPWK